MFISLMRFQLYCPVSTNFLNLLRYFYYYQYCCCCCGFTPYELFTLVDFYWSLIDCKFPHVSRTLLSILANLNNVVVWMVLSLSLISNSSNPFSKRLGTIPSAATSVDISVTFMSSGKVQVYVFSLSLIFILWSARKVQYTIRQVLFFLV